MKLGGYSHTNGITFFCDVFKVKTIKKGGKNEYKIDWIIPPKWLRRLEKKPIIGGISLLYLQWKVFDQRMKTLFLFLLGIFLLDEWIYIPPLRGLLRGEVPYKPWAIAAIVALLILNYKKIENLLRYHGAEHKVINCYCQHGAVSFSLVKDAKCYNRRCGTNLVAVFLVLYGIANLLKLESILLTLGLFLLAIQIVKKTFNKASKTWDWVFMKIQRLTVWEPRDEQIELAIQSFVKLIQAYDLYQRQLREEGLKKIKNS